MGDADFAAQGSKMYQCAYLYYLMLSATAGA